MKAGALKHRITLQYLSDPVQDPETGDTVREWTDAASVWAQVVPFSVREFLQAAAVQNETSMRAVVRFSRLTAQITPDWRVKYGSDVYDIKGVMPDPDTGREYLTLVCAKVV